MNEREPLTVSELTSLIKASLEGDRRFQDIYLHGEISNFKVYASGHAYFSLKDKGAVISAMMWNSYLRGISFRPKDGDEVLIRGKINVYPPRGSYAISVEMMERYGEGEALRKLRELAEKLSKEGLFDPSRKRKIKPFPTHIGVIAGRGSAGLRDIEVNLLRRYPIVQLHIYPSLVQGAEAPKALLEAFNKAKADPLDTLIIARGGGSSEDLAAFNDEVLVRALATSPCPIISAVGHEVDVTLTDLVADLRVSTPTAAAVASTPNKEDIYQYLDDALSAMSERMLHKIDTLSKQINLLAKRSFFLHPETIYSDKKAQLDEKKQRMSLAMGYYLSNKSQKLQSLQKRLSSLNPESLLSKGYAMIEDSQGQVLTSLTQVKIGEQMRVKMKDGTIVSEVIGKEQTHE